MKMQAKLTLHRAENIRLAKTVDRLQATVKVQKADIKYLNEVIMELHEENPE